MSSFASSDALAVDCPAVAVFTKRVRTLRRKARAAVDVNPVWPLDPTPVDGGWWVGAFFFPTLAEAEAMSAQLKALQA